MGMDEPGAGQDVTAPRAPNEQRIRNLSYNNGKRKPSKLLWENWRINSLLSNRSLAGEVLSLHLERCPEGVEVMAFLGLSDPFLMMELPGQIQRNNALWEGPLLLYIFSN